MELFFLKKKRYFECLIVSPTKLYSSKPKINQNICNVINNDNINGKKAFIDVNTYLKIKDPNPNKRPGIELLGYKIRIELPEYTITDIPKVSFEEEEDFCHSEDLSQNVDVPTNNNDVLPNKLEVIKQDEISTDLETSKEYYFKCSNNKCWYDATVVNYVYKRPFSLHKISWYNKNYQIESKWVNLYDYNINVPIEPYDKSFSQMIGDSKNKYTNNSKYYLKTAIEQSPIMGNPDQKKNNLETLFPESELDESELTCLNDCRTPPKIEYYGKIDCSKNEDCYKYGSYYCQDGKCETGYLNMK